MIPRPDVLIGNLTDVGMSRTVNQDYYGFYEPEHEEDFDRLGRLLVVCDGVGGHSGGEVASQVAVRAILSTYSQWESDDIGAALDYAIQAANRAILEESQRRPEIRDMATTVVALVLRHGTAHIAHVGDSRCYLVRQGELHQVTIDHSLVQQMFLEDLISEDEMETHPRKNVILRSLGLQPQIEVEVQELPYAVDDVFVISSDGLTGPVKKGECLEIIQRYFDRPMDACVALVDSANRHGGHDNITVQMARILAMTVEEGYRRLERRGPEWQHLLEDTKPVSAAKQLPSDEEMRNNSTERQAEAHARAHANTPPPMESGRVAPVAPAGAPAPAGPNARDMQQIQRDIRKVQSDARRAQGALYRFLYWLSRPMDWLLRFITNWLRRSARR